MDICVIGGGASGMAAAISAAGNPAAQVTVLERQARLGKKLLATGNGRCNLSNSHASISHYHGEDPHFAQDALEAFSVEKTLQWFAGLGLYTVEEGSGRIYPYSDQANSVVDVLRFGLEKENIQVKTGFEVEKIRKLPNGFSVESREEVLSFHKVIVACGGPAGTKLGGSLSGNRLLRSLGHHSTRLRPSLVQIESGWPGCGALRGVRAECQAQILHNGVPFCQSRGQIQFTQTGISGPVVFEISRDVCQGPGTWVCRLDLLPDLSEDALLHRLQARRNTDLTVQDLFTGILHNRLGRVLTGEAGLGGAMPLKELTDGDLRKASALAKNLEISLTKPLGMDCAQVTAGGIRTEEFDSKTMESKLVSGLFACGEVLDIDGDCGGFNLQWAWSSGQAAGKAAGEVAL